MVKLIDVVSFSQQLSRRLDAKIIRSNKLRKRIYVRVSSNKSIPDLGLIIEDGLIQILGLRKGGSYKRYVEDY